MAGGRGVALAAAPDGMPAAAWWFGEDQARYLVETAAEPDDHARSPLRRAFRLAASRRGRGGPR